MPKLQVDKALIRELGELLDETNLTEIEISEGNRLVRVSRAPAAAATAAPTTSVPPASPPSPAAADSAPVNAPAADHPGAVCSPMVGTVYLAPQPDAEAFVKAGDTVTEGQTLLIVEAMKVMNQIPAPKAGVIKEVMVEDTQPVEYGDVLVILE